MHIKLRKNGYQQTRKADKECQKHRLRVQQSNMQPYLRKLICKHIIHVLQHQKDVNQKQHICIKHDFVLIAHGKSRDKCCLQRPLVMNQARWLETFTSEKTVSKNTSVTEIEVKLKKIEQLQINLDKIAEDYCECLETSESLEIIQPDIEDINQWIESTEEGNVILQNTKVGYIVPGTLLQSQKQANCCLISESSLDAIVKKFFELESLPDDSKVITESEEEIFYVICNDSFLDDVLSGESTLESAKILQTRLFQLLLRRGFELHKWVSNSPELLKDLSASSYVIDKEFQDAPVETLGMLWDPKVDCLATK
ncbi:integrase catalytic domain-containing protein [Trichonephila clavipes]|nr:integrase catalytic domain-containing protein [Trichonephila clavipes]